LPQENVLDRDGITKVRKMTGKSDIIKQQNHFKYSHCDFISKRHGLLVLHSKEAHDVEL
jgi:hypothetical protein